MLKVDADIQTQNDFNIATLVVGLAGANILYMAVSGKWWQVQIKIKRDDMISVHMCINMYIYIYINIKFICLTKTSLNQKKSMCVHFTSFNS